jgi:DNA-binding CsgD family transcriptional regulator
MRLAGWDYFVRVSLKKVFASKFGRAIIHCALSFSLNVLSEDYSFMASAAVPQPGPDPSDKTSPQELLRALLIHAGIDDRSPASRNSEEILLDMELDGARYLLIGMPAVVPQRAQLSPREQEIVRMVAQGHPNKVIAGCLGISTWTVGTYVRRIFAKVGVGSRAAMVACVMDQKRSFDSGGSDSRPEKKRAVSELSPRDTRGASRVS